MFAICYYPQSGADILQDDDLAELLLGVNISKTATPIRLAGFSNGVIKLWHKFIRSMNESIFCFLGIAFKNRLLLHHLRLHVGLFGDAGIWVENASIRC